MHRQEEAADAVHRVLENQPVRRRFSLGRTLYARTLYRGLGKIDNVKTSVIKLDVKDTSGAFVPRDRLHPCPQICAEVRGHVEPAYNTFSSMQFPAHNVLKQSLSCRGISNRTIADGNMAVKATDGKPLTNVLRPRDIHERSLVSGKYESPTVTPLLFVLPCDHVVIARDQAPQPVMWRRQHTLG